jgi:acyl-coenzyme A thioesterase PaaI-like protein
MRMSMRETSELHVVGRADASPHLLGPRGDLRTGAILTMIDAAGGVNGGLASLPDGWVVTTNLAARVLAPTYSGAVRIESDLLRRGRNNVVTSVEVRAGDDALVASGVLTSSILVPENGPPVWERPLAIEMGDPARAGADLPSVPEWIGARSAGPDAIEIDLADDLRNPWGILHGGVVAMLVDLAAEHVTGDGRTTDVVLHYLAPNRVGPVRAVARLLGRRGDGTVVRVEVRDEGAARTTALAIVTSSARE